MNVTMQEAKSREYIENIPVFILQALRIHGKQSVHKLARETGYNDLTVKKYLIRLVKGGLVKAVPRGEVDFVLAEKGGK